MFYRPFPRAGFEDVEINDLMRVVAAVIHLGDIEFASDGAIGSTITTHESLAFLADVLGTDEENIAQALTHRTIVAHGTTTHGDLDPAKARYATEALGKALYNRMFSWIVQRVNQAITAPKSESRITVMGILDIYGFEIMQTNGFEQLCINYCNEKLQQLFIQLTLKAEQDEYRKEGIQWVPVTFFDNKVICDMVEARNTGIVAVLDNECLLPGDKDDDTFLANLNIALGGHDHYSSYKTLDRTAQRRNSMRGRGALMEFKIKHYAGVVKYSVDGFMDKNNDLLFRDLKILMGSTSNTIAKACFPKEELESLKRPKSAGTQFKESLNALIDILSSKSPSYIRCVKPNTNKATGEFDRDLVKHQSKYLALMENLRVRRAGFAYRRPYTIFLDRYKSLCKATWPNWRGSDKDGVEKIMQALGLDTAEYRLGHTKIFLKNPKTVFAIEERYQARTLILASKIAATWKMKLQREFYVKLRPAQIMVRSG